MSDTIKMEKVKKSFSRFEAIRNVDLEIQTGEILGLLGPSGAGKSTIIKLLTGQLEPSSGTVEVFGESGEHIKQSRNRKRFGVLTDNSGLYKRLTIEENLKMYCDLYELPESAMDEALQFVNLLPNKKKKVAQLSRGMMQRVTLARAILHKPELLFLDEPTSALDPVNTHHIHEGLRKLNAQGTTILLTTHDMHEAEALCHRVAFLHEGEIRESGSPKELKNAYRTDIIEIELTCGEIHELPVNEVATMDALKNWATGQRIRRIHSNEPTLGDLFMRVTGGELS
ncbi:ABC transporter ATP-binding protein [Chryseomicrobium sp. FSL W7-1435]|uniref:ABC transporter ATP-binding protein n=1 Tax=Chryseomicrobium sp. FSL W7-1435 TaxID=2921704 RepID=UPI003159BD44